MASAKIGTRPKYGSAPKISQIGNKELIDQLKAKNTRGTDKAKIRKELSRRGVDVDTVEADSQ